MLQTDFPEANAQVPDELTRCGVIPVMKTDDGGAISCWELTDDDILAMIDSKRLYLIHDIQKGFRPVIPVTDIHSYILDEERPLSDE